MSDLLSSNSLRPHARARRFRSIATAPRLTAAVMALCSAASGCFGAERSRPNVVFIYADDLGFGDIACHGHARVRTPHLDRLAREGTDFWSFTVVNPVCSPSRTGIVTGQFPSRWGVHQHFATHEQNVARQMPDWLDPAAPLLPRMLHEAGYATAHYGKWHLSGGGLADAPLPSEYGYDDAAVWTGPGKHVFEGTERGFAADEGSAHDEQAASWISVAATDHALRFVRDHADRPFYINLWLHETHHLVSATDEERAAYPDVPEPHKTYLAAVSRADAQVGRVLDLLDELQLAERTIVVFSSDNGPENSQPRPGDKLYHSVGTTGGLRGRKRSLLLGGVNVPFLVRWPGVVPAGRVDRETALAGVDVAPTLLAAAGVQPPADYRPDGENMLPAWRGEPQQRTKPVFWWWQGKHTGDDWPAFAMRDGRWMLVLDETRQRVELTDVVDDREQQRNRAAEQPERVASMRAAIETWFATLPKEVNPVLQSQTGRRPSAAAAAPLPAGQSNVDRGRAFSRWDTNRDEHLSLEEYTQGLVKKENAPQRFAAFDRNGDGRLTREEFVQPGE